MLTSSASKPHAGPFEAVIGLEVHVQLQTQSKLFCGCPTSFGAKANTHTCPVCLGLPGALPVLNRDAVLYALKAGMALGCVIHPQSTFSRKNYFYPDLPKGYQITQFHRPICGEAKVDFEVEGEPQSIRLQRIHMEEDAGKSIHTQDQGSIVDYNRAGVPLIEIVTEPDFRSPKQAASFVAHLREMLRMVGVCDGQMEQGSLRCDANVSLRPVGVQTLGTRAEIKNLNSFRFIAQAIAYEIHRQEVLLSQNEAIQQETRQWDQKSQRTIAMRSKADAHDYRYFSDPDLPDLILSQELIQSVRTSMPELASAKRIRFAEELNLSKTQIQALFSEPEIVVFFEQTLGHSIQGSSQKSSQNNSQTHLKDTAKSIANWLLNEVLGHLEAPADIDQSSITSAALADLVMQVSQGKFSGNIGKTVCKHLVQEGGSVADILQRYDLIPIQDENAIATLVQTICEQNPKAIAQYHAGKTQIIGFLLGQGMQQSRGKADPKALKASLLASLDASKPQ